MPNFYWQGSLFSCTAFKEQVIYVIINKILWAYYAPRKPFTNIYCFVISCRIRYNSGSTYYF